MVVLTVDINEVDIPAGVTHIGTDWQVSEDLHFNDVLLSITNTSRYLNYMLWSNSLDHNKSYYGRCRFLLSTGYTIWSNIDVFIPEEVMDIAREVNMPTKVSIPILETDSDFINHKPTLFTISTDSFGVHGNAVLESTSWWIEDIDRKAVWSSLRDTDNLKSITFTPDMLILNNSEPYYINAIFHTTSNDSSQVGSKLLIVNNNDKSDIVIIPDPIDVGVDNVLRLYNIEGLTDVNFKLELAVPDGNAEVLNTTITGCDDVELAVPANTLLLNREYMLTTEPILNTVSIRNRYALIRT